MRAPFPPTQVVSPYEAQAHSTALTWTQLALSTLDPQFDFEPAKQVDIHGSITARHTLRVESETTRWYGRIQSQTDDIVCTDEAEFQVVLSEQRLIALYNREHHNDLKQRVVGAEYAAHREPSVLQTCSPRVTYHHLCSDCSGGGNHTCTTCRGHGETRCVGCAGAGDETCSTCGGSGQQELGNSDSHGNQVDDWANCESCSGTGSVDCGSCGGLGWEACRDCRRSGVVPCLSCNGCGSLSEVGHAVLRHSPCYQIRVDPDGPESAIHVVKFFGETGLTGHATVTLISIHLTEADEASCSVTWNFEYRFELPAALVKVQTRREIFGPSMDHTEWTIAGRTPQVIDTGMALFPLLAGKGFDAKRNSRWQICLRPGFNHRMSKALTKLLSPAVHRWILDGTNRNLSVDAIFVQIRRSLDPSSIQMVTDTVNRALAMSYRRRLLLHQLTAMLMTLAGVAVLTATPTQPMRGLRRQLVAITKNTMGVQLEDAVMLVAVVVLTGLVLSFYARHKAWLLRAGGVELRMRAAQLKHLNFFTVGLRITAVMVVTAAVSVALVLRFWSD